MKLMRELILILAMILALAWVYKDIKANELIIKNQGEIISRLEYQNSMIANTLQKSIDDRFNSIECILDN